MLQRSSSSRISMAAGTLERSKGRLRRWSCPGLVASDRSLHSSGPRSLAVWESGQTSRRWGGTEKKTQRSAAAWDLQQALPPPDPTSPTAERLKNVNCPPHVARRLFPPARLIRLMAPWHAWVLGPPRPHVNRPPNAKHFLIEPDETNGEGRDNKVKTPDGPPQVLHQQNAPFSFVPSFVRVNSKTTQPTVAIRARLQRTRRAEAHAKGPESLRLVTDDPNAITTATSPPCAATHELSDCQSIKMHPGDALTAFLSLASRPRLCRPKPKEIAGADADADADARSSGAPPLRPVRVPLPAFNNEAVPSVTLTVGAPTPCSVTEIPGGDPQKGQH